MPLRPREALVALPAQGPLKTRSREKSPRGALALRKEAQKKVSLGQPPADPESPDEGAALRKTQLLAICHGNQEIFRGMMEEFLACVIRAQEELSLPMTLEEAEKVAHRLRGSISYLVEGGATERLRALEEACVTRDSAAVSPAILSAKRSLEALEALLRKELIPGGFPAG